MLDYPSRNRMHRKSIWLVLAAACGFFLSAAALGLWHAAEMRNIVSGQFNEEQLVIAQNVARLIERELGFLEKEIRLLVADVASDPFNPQKKQAGMQTSFARVIESGVRKIMLVQPGSNGAPGVVYHCIANECWATSGRDEKPLSFFPEPGMLPPESVWFSKPTPGKPQIIMYMAAGLPDPKDGLIVFDINVSWLLDPFLKDIRSGKTGYAWIISDDGFFLYHPEKDFIGRDAFGAREQKDPRISFHTINFIQQEKMLKGMAGAGSYESGWHRGMTGRIQKLIAYSPIRISDPFAQKWAIAVVAPVVEIESLVNHAYNRQLLLQLLILAAIVTAASAIWLFEKKWSRFLEMEVRERTRDLSRSEEKYRSLVESAEDIILTMDEDRKFTSINPFAAAFFGKNLSECMHQPLSSLFPKSAAEKTQALADQVFLEARSVRDILEITENHYHKWLNANLMPLKNKNGRVSGVLLIARDITEQKDLESRLIHAEKLASLGTLAAGVAHEINNPISVILGFSALLLQDVDPGSQVWEDLKTIERQGLHCKQIVESLLSFTRHGQESAEYTDLYECIGEVVKIVRHSLEMNDIELDMDLAPLLPPVSVDFRQLQQVFLNLVNNAMAAMPEGGRLGICGRMDGENRWVRISLSDTGMGIPAPEISRIFEPFYTTRPEGEGTGLGLFISYGIISRYGGTIECESRADETSGNPGTVFTLSLKPAPQKTGIFSIPSH